MCSPLFSLVAAERVTAGASSRFFQICKYWSLAKTNLAYISFLFIQYLS